MSRLDSETRQMFAGTIRRLLPVAEGRPDRDGDSLWRELAESGVLALGLPESAQGLGGDMTELGMVMRMVGASLTDVPYLSTVIVCSRLITRLDPEHAAERLGAVAAGDLKLSLAHHEPAAGYADAPLRTRASMRGSGYALTGIKSPVLDAAADIFLVTASEPSGATRVFLVEPGATGLDVAHRRSVDGRTIATLTMNGVPATPLGTREATDEIAAALLRANVAICAEALGAMEAIAEKTREYLKTRHAFGRTLSQFQVLQHRFVDMLIALEETRAVVEAAEAACEQDSEAQEIVARTCKVTTAKAARFVSAQGIQLHGGVGMTDELVISHYYKRLMAIEAAFGNGEHHLRALARDAQRRYGVIPGAADSEPVALKAGQS